MLASFLLKVNFVIDDTNRSSHISGLFIILTFILFIFRFLFVELIFAYRRIIILKSVILRRSIQTVKLRHQIILYALCGINRRLKREFRLLQFFRFNFFKPIVVRKAVCHATRAAPAFLPVGFRHFSLYELNVSPHRLYAFALFVELILNFLQLFHNHSRFHIHVFILSFCCICLSVRRLS